MSQAERDRFKGRICEECGLPVPACSLIAMQRTVLKSLRRAILPIIDEARLRRIIEENVDADGEIL